MKYPLSEIQPIAIELWTVLKPHCSKIKIAGSIRRQQLLCKDIEIVMSPLGRSERNKIGLFFLQNARILKGGFTEKSVKGRKKGGRYVKAIYKGYPVDVFIAQDHDYYRQLAIRTGSAEYSKRIASNWCDKGYQGTDLGLIQNCMQLGAEPSLVTPMTWDSERHFFEWLGMEYLEPNDRF